MNKVVKVIKPLTVTQKQKCLTIIQNVVNLIKIKHT